MIQVVEYCTATGEHVPGKGQQIECQMAQEVGIKVFRVYQLTASRSRDSTPVQFSADDIEALLEKIQAWRWSGREDMDVTDVFLAGANDRPNNLRQSRVVKGLSSSARS